MQQLRGTDTLDGLSAFSAKGNNYLDFLFALLHMHSLQKGGKTILSCLPWKCINFP